MTEIPQQCAGRTLVAAHRGEWMGNIPCNTVMSFNAALRDGADIVELDISKSAEGTLYVFHPGTEPRFLHSEKLIKDMTDAEVDAQRLVNVDGAFTQYQVPKFDDVLEELKGRCIINIDKFPYYPREIAETVRRHGMVDQALVKTDTEERFFRMVEETAPEFQYMVFAWDKDDVSDMLLQRKLHYIGTEAYFRSEESEFATESYHDKMHRKGLVTWANAIVCNPKTVHANGHTDDLYTIGREDEGWGYLARLGYDMIQTDWTAQCVRYLRLNGFRG